MQPKAGGKSHLRLNTDGRPIANKYREGKMKRTLKRELKVLEIVEGEEIGSLGCAQAYAGLTAGCMCWVLVSIGWPGGTSVAFVGRPCRLDDRGTKGAL
jgi:hypothetical protein